jgi:hypothetical protein
LNKCAILDPTKLLIFSVSEPIHFTEEKGEQNVVSGRHLNAGEFTTERSHDGRYGKTRILTFLRVWTNLFLILLCAIFAPSLWASAGETSEHFSKSLEIPLEGDSLPHTLTFPLYEQNNVRYFSAGLGKEERSLSYPPYPLKLIFVKGERAYLTNVAVEILHPDRTKLLSIPEEEVQGPWLFLNLPAGKYIINATDSSGISQEKTVNLTAKGTTNVYFRWQ